MSCYGCFWMAWSVRSCVRAAPSPEARNRACMSGTAHTGAAGCQIRLSRARMPVHWQ